VVRISRKLMFSIIILGCDLVNISMMIYIACLYWLDRGLLVALAKGRCFGGFLYYELFCVVRHVWVRNRCGVGYDVLFLRVGAVVQRQRDVCWVSYVSELFVYRWVVRRFVD